MSIQPIIQTLEKLVQLHESLLEISRQKTDVIKEGLVEKLQVLLVKERKHVQAIEQVEGKRQKEVEDWFHTQDITGDQTITGILDHLTNPDEKSVFEENAIALTTVITKLKQQEGLNQALLHQSLQFIELSLDTINPSMKTINYGKQAETTPVNRSLFDSKA